MRLRLWNIVKLVKNQYRKHLQTSLDFYPSHQSKLLVDKALHIIQLISSRFSAYGIGRKVQYLLALGIVIFVFGSAVYFVHQIYALTLYFTQSDWSGGADTESTINSSNASGWTKFYSKTAGMDNSTAGEIKLKLETSP